MSYALVVLGAVVVLVVFVDAFMTTLALFVSAGPLTGRALSLCWRAMLALRRARPQSKLLASSGTILLSTTVLLWMCFLWAGWTLVYLGSDSVVHAQTEQAADFADVVYYAGVTLFTLGLGDFVADAPPWRILSAVTSFSGLFLATLAITYLVSVISAVVAQRSLAIQIRALGRSADDIVVRGWTGDRFSEVFEQHLVALTPAVATSAEQHFAYPVLHYFHSPDQAFAPPLAFARLQDALLLLTTAVAEAHRPDPNAVEPLTYAIEQYVHTATDIAWVPAVAPPPFPEVGRLQEAGIPLAPTSEREQLVSERGAVRTQLHQLVQGDGWSWQPSDTSEGRTSRR